MQRVAVSETYFDGIHESRLLRDMSRIDTGTKTAVKFSNLGGVILPTTELFRAR